MDFVKELEAEVAAGSKCAPVKDKSPWYRGTSSNNESRIQKGRARQAAHAQAICAGCPVMSDCFELALRIPAGKHGVWGGAAKWEREGRYVKGSAADAADAQVAA